MATDFKRYEADLNAKCVCGCMDGNRFHKTYRFPNNYGASVVSNPKTAGRNPGGFMVLPIKFITPLPENEYVIEMDQPIEGLAVECRDWAEVEVSLAKIMNH